MMEREQLIEFVEGIVTKEQLENVATVEQVEEQNRKLMARIDVQQSQLDGLQALLGSMQVKITQMQLQIVRMEELLAAKDSETTAAYGKREEMACKTDLPQEETAKNQMQVNTVPEEPVKPEEPVRQELPVIPAEPAKPEEPAEPEEPVKPVEPAVTEKPVEKENAKESVAKPTIADAIKGGESLAEKLSKRVERETVAASLNSAKIDRLQTAITIADRFRFQRELFAGDAVKMAETVELLNKMKNLDEALAYIEKNFDWDMDSPVTMDFLRLVERRF